MLRPEVQPPLRPGVDASTAPAVLPARPMVSGGSFGALFNEVQAEVSDFIQNGSSGAGSAETGLASMSGLGATGIGRIDTPEGAVVEQPVNGARQAFLDAIAPWAEDAGRQLGVAPHIVAAHAALESGWGQRPLRGSDGADTHNLFGVKAGATWTGDVASALTTEHEGGVATKTSANFRSYADEAGAFHDYARLLLRNPRYHAALNTGSDARAFAQGLVRGGYATDPAYADKLARVAAQLQSRE